MKSIAVTILFAVIMLAGSQIMAQETDEAAPAPAEPPATAAQPAPAPAAEPIQLQTTPVKETAPDSGETTETDMTAPEGDKPAEGENQESPKQKSTWTLVDRVSVGVLGSDLAAEYGFQAEWSAPHFGISFFWAHLQPYPDETDFNWDLGFVFHYYPLGKGPGNLYVGPGFCLAHLERDRDPFGLLVADPIAVTSGLTRFEGRQRQKFELIGPIVEIGYRHTFQVHSAFGITLGISATGGYLFSDQVRFYDNSAYFVVTPQFGFSW